MLPSVGGYRNFCIYSQVFPQLSGGPARCSKGPGFGGSTHSKGSRVLRNLQWYARPILAGPFEKCSLIESVSHGCLLCDCTLGQWNSELSFFCLCRGELWHLVFPHSGIIILPKKSISSYLIKTWTMKNYALSRIRISLTWSNAIKLPLLFKNILFILFF